MSYYDKEIRLNKKLWHSLDVCFGGRFLSCPCESLRNIISDPTVQTRLIITLPISRPASPLGTVCTLSFNQVRWGCNTLLQLNNRGCRTSVSVLRSSYWVLDWHGEPWWLHLHGCCYSHRGSSRKPFFLQLSKFAKLLPTGCRYLNKTHANCCLTPLLCKAKLLFIYVTFSFN